MFSKFLLVVATFSLFIAMNACASASPKLYVSIYNVGQGNCVHVSCPQNDSLLIDCGSSEHSDGKRLNDPEEPPIINFEKIKEKIIRFSQIKPVTIIVSHLDKDHYNLLDLIFDTSDYRDLVDKVIIIGDRESLGIEIGDGIDRRKAKANLLGWITTLENEGKTVEFYDRYNDPALQAAIPACGIGVLTPLTANVCNQLGSTHPNCGPNEITNANSLVLKLNHGTCGAILPGDALGVTTDDIINKDPPVDYHSTVLLMSHHGAILHDANSDLWINNVNPKIMPISVGKNSGYGHPSCRIIDKIVRGEIAPQLLTNSSMLPVPCYTDVKHFHSLATNKSVMSTFNTGNIHIYFNERQVTVGDDEYFDYIKNAPCA